MKAECIVDSYPTPWYWYGWAPKYVPYRIVQYSTEPEQGQDQSWTDPMTGEIGPGDSTLAHEGLGADRCRASPSRSMSSSS